MKHMPFVKKGDLVHLRDGPGPIVAVVLEVHTRSEPHMGSQLVLDGNPIDCTAHYVASLLVEGSPVRYKFDVRFWWETRACRVNRISVRPVGTHQPWSCVEILR